MLKLIIHTDFRAWQVSSHRGSPISPASRRGLGPQTVSLCMYVCIYIYIYIDVDIYIYIYIYICKYSIV